MQWWIDSKSTYLPLCVFLTSSSLISWFNVSCKDMAARTLCRHFWKPLRVSVNDLFLHSFCSPHDYYRTLKKIWLKRHTLLKYLCTDSQCHPPRLCFLQIISSCVNADVLFLSSVLARDLWWRGSHLTNEWEGVRWLVSWRGEEV